MASNPTATLKVPIPKMGGQRSNKIVWTGGVPKADWSSLEMQTIKPYSVHCYRYPNDPADEAKATVRRTTPPKGVIIKAQTSDFYFVKNSLIAHSKEHGIDSIFYVPDPKNPTQVISVLEQHSRLTMEDVAEGIKTLKPAWDDFDHENDHCAQVLLLNTLDREFARQLQSLHLHTLSAAEVWMMVTRSIQSTSAERFDLLRQKLRDLSPLKIAGQNIMAYCREVREIIQELIEAGQWQWYLLLNVMKGLLQATVPTFQAAFYPIRLAVDRLLTKCASRTDSEVEALFRDAGYHWSDILMLAEDTYRSLLDNGEWGPAGVAKDQKAPDRVFNLANMTVSDIKALLATLDETKAKTGNTSGKPEDGRNGNKRKCWTCGGTDHIASNCPKKGKDKQEPSKENWRTQGPKDGEQNAKVIKDDIYFWCPKCRKGKGLWTKTHREHGGETLTPEQLKKAKVELQTRGTVPQVLVAESPTVDISEGISW